MYGKIVEDNIKSKQIFEVPGDSRTLILSRILLLDMCRESWQAGKEELAQLYDKKLEQAIQDPTMRTLLKEVLDNARRDY